MATSRRAEGAKEWLGAVRTWVAQARGKADASELDVVKLHEEGRYREAEVAARRLVDSLRETRGERHPHYATALSNLALSVQKQGNYAAAEPLLRQVLDIRRETLGETHPHYATALNNLALLLCERGDLAAAEPLLRQALEVRRQALGAMHPDHATGLTSLAMLLCERGDLTAAEPLLRQALDIRREALGDHHPHYATALKNLALVLRETGDPAGAEPLLREALVIRRETLGEHHPETEDCARALESLRPPAPAEPPPAESAAAEERSSRQYDVPSLRNTWRTLVERFAYVSDHLGEAVERMRAVGLPPDEALLDEAAACRRDFTRFRDEVFALAESVGVSELSPPETSGLPELAALLDIAAEAHEALGRHEERRERALGMAQDVRSLQSRDPAYDEVLNALHEQADALREAIAASPPLTLPADAERLADGDHQFASVLTLVRGAPDLDDAGWNDVFETVSSSYGRPAAVALARGKVFLPGAEPTPEARG